MQYNSQTECPPVMTVAEVAIYLRIPRGSVYKLAQQGRIPCQKVGKHWRFRREAIYQWLGNGGSAIELSPEVEVHGSREGDSAPIDA